MPRGQYLRGAPRRELRPLPVPKMPPKSGPWKAGTRRTWASWFESGRASLLDDAGIAALGRLMLLIDKADTAGWPVDEAKEVRLAERALTKGLEKALAKEPATEPEPEPKTEFERLRRAAHGRPPAGETDDERRERRRAGQRALRALCPDDDDDVYAALES